MGTWALLLRGLTNSKAILKGKTPQESPTVLKRKLRQSLSPDILHSLFSCALKAYPGWSSDLHLVALVGDGRSLCNELDP